MGSPSGELFDNNNSSIDTSTSTGQNDSQAQGSSYNPAFQPLLNDIPQDLHSKVIPYLQQWDQGVTQRFQKVQQEYEPWKSIINMGATPDTVQAGLNVINLIEQNPEILYKALRDHYKFGDAQQGSLSQGQTTEPSTEESDPYRSRFEEMERGFNTLAEHVIQQRQAEENTRADAAVDQEIQTAKQKYGEVFDESWVIARCIANPQLSVDEAAQQYQQWYQQQMSRFGAKPLIMGGGGSGLPQNNVDVTKLSGKETRSLVAQMIEQANQQSRG